MTNPYVPFRWTRNAKGMQNTEYLTDSNEIDTEIQEHLAMRDIAVAHVRKLHQRGIHKQHANRYLEPFLYHKIVVTATNFSNFFAQRCDADAQDDIRMAAELMQRCLQESKPEFLFPGQWHLPYVHKEELKKLVEKQSPRFMYDMAPDDWDKAIAASVVRCARVSYNRQGEIKDDEAERYQSLLSSNHWSPFEHQAQAMDDANSDYKSGNFTGWVQNRKTHKGECR